MPKTKAHLRSSRRVPSLKDNEIDHEISLVDHTALNEEPPTPNSTINIDHSTSNQPLISSDSRSPSTQPPETEDGQPKPNADVEAGPSGEQDTSQTSTKDTEESVTGKKSVSKENDTKKSYVSNKRRTRSPKDYETAIDILYENQRGGFLCGIPLFSSAALGNLDPTPWTNFAHKPSPTDINTAQVPDPSWEWAWPEWRINRDETIQTDSDGWEYSFMFAKVFSWHGPKWYNSFVRRRAWIRRRIKKGIGYQANDAHLMNPEYFSVTPTRRDGERTSIDQLTARISQETHRMSRDTRRGAEDDYEIKVEITTVHDLMTVLRRSRIDRERLEAMENYIEHCSDELRELDEHMHEIMSLFVFQATRKLLLARLIKFHDEQVDERDKGGKGKSPAIHQMAENLVAAIKHADEELRRLEYWSDIKDMAESGESRGAVDCGKGWDRTWEGLDNSGPKGVKDESELPK
ncbi:uncharacterized protein GGS22DRAFT_171677 [Annulohypoxylon maeteangense]|uniref:uncharacterized protein n=1 Tax=Annulohypoxylon maeteangense TaxID=1927788 RepID=UPI002007A8F7|nr:uncharacterized protein GGS22DRAFT_171677 [Annulohypoxylon maeteangense]KAI0881715.1 hypothetical protein GGS22DRAFT_171677 [Annulohypoxylon maeteangense]